MICYCSKGLSNWLWISAPTFPPPTHSTPAPPRAVCWAPHSILPIHMTVPLSTLETLSLHLLMAPPWLGWSQVAMRRITGTRSRGWQSGAQLITCYWTPQKCHKCEKKLAPARGLRSSAHLGRLQVRFNRCTMILLCLLMPTALLFYCC